MWPDQQKWSANKYKSILAFRVNPYNIYAPEGCMMYCQLPCKPTFKKFGHACQLDIIPLTTLTHPNTMKYSLDDLQHHKPNRTTLGSQLMHEGQFFINLLKSPRICFAESNDTIMSTNTANAWQRSILHHPSVCRRYSFCHTLKSLIQETGNRKPWIFLIQNILIHLSPTLNILSQKAQPFGRSNHCGPPKCSLVHHHMSAHICRLHNSWWQDVINSLSLRTHPRDLLCAFERFSCHSWQTACWYSPLFALKHMNTQ
jgi:hypothetical protein